MSFLLETIGYSHSLSKEKRLIRLLEKEAIDVQNCAVGLVASREFCMPLLSSQYVGVAYGRHVSPFLECGTKKMGEA